MVTGGKMGVLVNVFAVMIGKMDWVVNVCRLGMCSWLRLVIWMSE